MNQQILITINFATYFFKLINKLYCNNNGHIFVFYLYYDNIFIVTKTVTTIMLKCFKLYYN